MTTNDARDLPEGPPENHGLLALFIRDAAERLIELHRQKGHNCSGCGTEQLYAIPGCNSVARLALSLTIEDK